MPELVLAGCRPVPLAHYLKALGVLRLVAEQADPGARGAFTDRGFVLTSALDAESLVAFFLERYRPTPIVGPWNGGSGFYPKDNRAALDRIAASTGDRWADYRTTIVAAQHILASRGAEEKVDKAAKDALLLALRGRLPDAALEWLDAALLLTAEGPKYPPLLGTGGNDGRLDFTNNFMQRLVELLDPGPDQPPAETRALLRHALFDEAVDALAHKAIGQFLPGDAGGANAGAGFDGEARINPWDFVLALEGAVMFAAVAARRLERAAPGVLAYPFTVHAVGAGYGSAAARDADDARAEMWLPLWSRPAGLAELRTVLGEGRAHVGRRSPRDGVDFARAVASLGVDRGLDAFERYGFHVRNGLAYFAVPLGRFEVGAAADPLREIAPWFDRFRQAANRDLAPARIRRALHRLERAVVEACRHGHAEHRTTNVLLALGACERAMAESLAWSSESGVRPIPRLDPNRWLAEVDRSVELRIAAAVTSLEARRSARAPSLDATDTSLRLPPIRDFIAPLEGTGTRLHWLSTTGPDHVGIGSVPERSLLDLLQRRVLWARRHGATAYRDQATHAAPLADVAAFVEGIDDDLLGEHLWACTLLDWPRASRDTRALLRRGAPRGPQPGPAYALLKLCFAGRSVPLPASDERPGADTPTVEIPTLPAILRLLEAERGHDALEAARRRLRGSGLVSPLEPFELAPAMARRLGAALLIPLSKRDLARLARSVTRPHELPDHDPLQHEETQT